MRRGRLFVCAGLLGCASLVQAQGTAFVDEALVRGINYTTSQGFQQYGCGVALIDLDLDGDADAVVTGASTGRVGVYENDGTGHFIDRSFFTGIPPFFQASAVAAADYDADGDLDLYISSYLANDALLRNDGSFTFTDVSGAAGILPGGPSAGVAWGDYDADGHLDLYVTNRTGESADFTENRLYHNLGDGTFEEVAAALGVQDPLAPTLLCAWLDYDLDGDSDLYLGTDKGTDPRWSNKLYQNQGDGTFLDVTAQTNTAANVHCMGIAFGDFDFNGWPDIYVTNVQYGNVLLMNDNGTFTDESVAAGVQSFEVGWGTAFFDYNNDTNLELYVCNTAAPNRFYQRTGAFPCADIASVCGVDDPASSYCMALGDVDLDGDLDLMVQSWGQRIRLYINHEGQNNPWARFRVRGEGANTFGIGSTVTISSGGVSQFREIHGGNNYKSHNEQVAQFGLGSTSAIDSVAVTWPSGTTRSLTGYNGLTTWTLLPPSKLGDGDRDGDVDIFDIRAAASCLGLVAPGCEVYDMDGNGTIDRTDLIAMGLSALNRRP